MTFPEPQNEVESALLGAAEDGSRFPEFFRLLAGAEVMIPQPGDRDDASGERRIEDGAELALPLVEHEGQTYVPVFTSKEQFRLGVSDREMAFVRLPIGSLIAEWPEDHGLAVNPGGEMGVALDSRTVRGLGKSPDFGAASTQQPGGGSTVLLGGSATEPSRFLGAVAEACRSHGGVRAAYRALMAAEGEDDKPQIVIGIELDAGIDPEQFFADFGPRVAPAAEGSFSLVVVDETNLSSVARFMLLETDPFFVRDG